MAAGKHLLGMPKNHQIFGTAKVGEKGQIVIPKEARTFFNIKSGDTLLILGDGEHGLVVTKPQILDDVAEKILGHSKEKEV